MNTEPERLLEIHRLRGVAILMIVATHAYQFFGWAGHPFAAAFFEDTFDDSSVLFIFIAGFLFQYLAERRFSYREYFLRKTRNVILPYLIALTPALLYVLFREPGILAAGPLRDVAPSGRVFIEVVYPGLTPNYALWFVPVIAIYYLAAPLFRFIDKSQSYWTVALLLPLSLLMHRPTYGYGHNLSLALYFLSSYVLGMCCSRYRTQVFSLLDRHLVPLTLLFITVFVGHLLLSDHHGKSQTHEPFIAQGEDGLIDWLYLQKVLMTLVLLGIVHRFRNLPAAALDYLAGVSFTIFFYHLYVVFVLSWSINFSVPEFMPALLLLVFVLVVGIPCILAFLVQKIFPHQSRALVGA